MATPERHSHFIVLAGFLGAAVAFGVGTIQLLLGSQVDFIAGVTSGLGAGLAAVGWKLTNGNRLVPHLAMGVLCLSFSWPVWFGATTYAAWLGLVSLVGFMLLGRKGGLWWTLGILAFLAFSLLYLSRPDAPPLPAPGSAAVRLLRVASLVPTIAMMGYLFERQRELDVQALHRAMDSRSRMLHAVSHEMRTPLNGIIGTTQLLHARHLDDDTMDKVSTIEFSSETLLALINDLLDASRAEAGKLEFHSAAFDARRVVELTTELHRPRANAQGKALRLTLPDGPLPVMGDSVRVRQVVGNLVANALRHGGPNVEVRLGHTRHGDHEWLTLVVSDDGPGIDEQRLSELFQPFSQLNPQTAAGGSGLGLFISRTVARSLGGDLRYERSADTRFVLELKLPCAKEVGTATPQPAHPLRGVVLAVDDNPINLKVARGLLEKLGLQVHTAESGEEALASLASHHVDLVLMDLQMPGLDGLETTRRLRSGGSQTPVFALTASASPETSQACTAAGMNGCLHKPVQLAELRDALGPLLRRRAA